MARMHVGADRPVAERVDEHPVGPANPVPAVGMREVVHDGPAHLRRLQVRDGPRDHLGDPAGQLGNVVRVGPRPSRPWPPVPNGCASPKPGSAPPPGRSARGRAAWPGRSVRAGACNCRPRRGTDASSHRRAPTPRIQSVADRPGTLFEEPAVDQDRELRGSDVDHGRTGPEDLLRLIRPSELGEGLEAARQSRGVMSRQAIACVLMDRWILGSCVGVSRHSAALLFSATSAGVSGRISILRRAPVVS